MWIHNEYFKLRKLFLGGFLAPELPSVSQSNPNPPILFVELNSNTQERGKEKKTVTSHVFIEQLTRFIDAMIWDIFNGRFLRHKHAEKYDPVSDRAKYKNLRM